MVKDLYDGFVVGYALSTDKSVKVVSQSINNALDKIKVTDGLILHSDQGLQYSSKAYFVLTNKYNIQASMSRRARPLDNAPIESFFGHFKEEAYRHINPKTIEEVKQIVDDYIAFYNYERIQLKTKLTPCEVRRLYV